MKLSAISAAILIGIGACLPAWSSPDYDQAIALYNARRYNEASKAFEVALRHPVTDPNVVYYAALNAQQLGQYEKARTYFQSLLKSAPGTDAARMAQIALSRLSTSKAVNIDNSNLPKETWVPFERLGTHIQVNAEVNGHPAKMLFDTGADHCMISSAMMESCGLSIPDRAPDAYSGGVGNAKYAPTWMIPVTLKVGRIERRNFRVSVTKTPQVVALLGRDFYSGLQYTVDDKNSSLVFKRTDGPMTAAAKNSDSGRPGPDGSTTVTESGGYQYNVPYRTAGTQIIVTAKVNGQPCDMIFDTGAAICFFTGSQAASVGLNPGPNAPAMAINGVGGNAVAHMCPISTMKLGPIEQHDVTAAVGEKTVSPMPLCGQSFFKDFQYTIDSNNKVIHFMRR